MFSRKIRSRLPVLPSKLGSFKQHNKVFEKESERKKKQERNYNKRHRSKALSKLKVNDRVWVIDSRVYAKIIRPDKNPNSYIIKTEKGSTIRRNRWHLVPAPDEQRIGKGCDYDLALIDDDKKSASDNSEKQTIIGQDASDTSSISDREANENLQEANEPRRSKRIQRPSTRLRDFLTY
jgi:hypothetical protein